MRVIGIDPGAEGGFCCIDYQFGGMTVVMACMIPFWKPQRKRLVESRNLGALFREAILYIGNNLSTNTTPQTVFVIEDIATANASGAGGKVGAFSSGRTLGAIEATAGRFGNPVYWVTPDQWKKKMGLIGGSKQDSIDLATARFGTEVAEKYWPLKKHDGIAEAALIAAYWIEKFGGRTPA